MAGGWQLQTQCGAEAVDPTANNTPFPSTEDYDELNSEEMRAAAERALGEADWKKTAQMAVASNHNLVFVVGGVLSDNFLGVPLSRVSVLRVRTPCSTRNEGWHFDSWVS